MTASSEQEMCQNLYLSCS